MALLNSPVITLEAVKIRSLTLSTLELELNLRIDNPNLFGVTLRELPFTVLWRSKGNEQVIATGKVDGVKIQGRSSATLSLPVTADNAGTIRAVTSLLAQGGIDVEVRGTAVIDCIVACPAIPFTRSLRLTTGQIAGAISDAVTPKEE